MLLLSRKFMILSLAIITLFFYFCQCLKINLWQMAYNVPDIRRLGGLTETAQMWVRFCVGTSVATDLAKPNPGGGACRRRSVYRMIDDGLVFANYFIHHPINVPYCLELICLATMTAGYIKSSSSFLTIIFQIS